MPAIGRTATRGFTLIELMIVVSILGILAAVAIPAFNKLMRRSKTTEAVDKLAHMFRNSSTYFTGERGRQGFNSGIVPHQFPATQGITPMTVPPGVSVVDPAGTWQTPTWQALSFSINDPHFYSYSYDSMGTATGAMFTARANGDLDGSGQLSTFERSGGANSLLEVQGSQGIWMNHETD